MQAEQRDRVDGQRLFGLAGGGADGRSVRRRLLAIPGFIGLQGWEGDQVHLRNTSRSVRVQSALLLDHRTAQPQPETEEQLRPGGRIRAVSPVLLAMAGRQRLLLPAVHNHPHPQHLHRLHDRPLEVLHPVQAGEDVGQRRFGPMRDATIAVRSSRVQREADHNAVDRLARLPPHHFTDERDPNQDRVQRGLRPRRCPEVPTGQNRRRDADVRQPLHQFLSLLRNRPQVQKTVERAILSGATCRK